MQSHRRDAPTSPTERRGELDSRVVSTDGGPRAPGPDVASGPTHAALVELRKLVASPAVDVVSTDVFDTFVWRRVPEPVDAFTLLGERLAARNQLHRSLTPESVAQLRLSAEHRARELALERHGYAEITLAEIWEQIPEWAVEGGRERGMEAELALEYDLLVPDLDLVEVLNAAMEANKTLALVSNTYYSGDQLRALLSRPVTFRLAFRHVLASSDYREGKTGRLFDRLLEIAGTAPGRIVHIGDDLACDVEAPRARGMLAAHVERRSERLAKILADEKAFLDRRPGLARAVRRPGATAPGDHALSSLRSKMEARVELDGLPTSLQPFWLYGAQVLGPVLTGFADWVHVQATDLGARHVLCLMREGALLADLITAAAPAATSAVEARTLWVNRDIATRAALGAATREELETLFKRRTPLTLSQLCRLLGIAATEIPHLAPYMDASLEDPTLREIALRTLSTEGPLREAIVARSRTLRERLLRLVNREAPGDGPIVLVDLGWGATIQRRLQEALEQAGSSRVLHGLYVLTQEQAIEALHGRGQVRGFLANLGAPPELVAAVLRSPEIIEQACMPALGAQIDLDANLEPVLVEAGPRTIQHAEIEAVQLGARAFQREYVRYRLRVGDAVPPLHEAAEELGAILARAVANPTAQEAAMLGRWRHDENQGVERSESVVESSWHERARYLSPAQLAKLPMESLYWPYGLARAGDPAIADLAALATAGVIPWDATAGTVESGAMAIEAVAGIGIEDVPPVIVTPLRNRHGLSFISGSLRAPDLERIQIRLCERPVIIRVDYLRFRVWLQGESGPTDVVIDTHSRLADLGLVGVIQLAPNVLATITGDAVVAWSPRTISDRPTVRIDVELAFAALPCGPHLVGRNSLGSLLAAREQLRRMEESKSWRITRPMRWLSAKLRRS